MSSIIQSMDYFGTSFQLTTLRNSKFKTFTGGLLTIISFVIILVFSFLFGKDFFYRLNPHIVTQIVNPDNYHEPFLLTNENMNLALRISDRNAQPVNFEGIIYPFITHFSYVSNSSGTFLIDATNLNITRCTKEIIKDEKLIRIINLNDWFCIDWRDQDLEFGGYWDAPFLHFIEIDLYTCKGQKFENGSCTDPNRIREFLGGPNGVFFEIYYPEYYFAPNDIENPLKVHYKNYFHLLNFELKKVDTLFFKDVQMFDDLGWILQSPEKRTLFSAAELTSEYQLISGDDNGKENLRSLLYVMTIYSSKIYDKINRSYMKFQDFAAIIGGFMRIVLVFFGGFSFIFNSFSRNEILFNNIFEYNQENTNAPHLMTNLRIPRCDKMEEYSLQNEQMNKKSLAENNNSNMSKKLKKSPRNLVSNFEFMAPSIDNSNPNLNLNNVPIINILNNLNNKNKVKRDYSYFSIKHRANKISKDMIDQLQPHLQNQKQVNYQKIKTHHTIKFGLRFIIKFYLLSCGKREIKGEKQRLFNFINTYLSERMDIIYYLKTLEKFDRFRILGLNYYQNLSLEFLKRPNLNCKQDLENLDINMDLSHEDKFNELVNYFAYRKKNEELDDLDEQLLGMVHQEIIQSLK